MSVIRVVIADDSQVARDVLRDILSRDDDIEIVGEATNGREAVELAKRLAPQLITMDLNMPVMDGLSAIEEIMHSKGVPILVVSDRSDAQTAYQALEVGALEVMPKPTLEGADAERLVERVRLLAGVAVITRLRRRVTTSPPFITSPPLPAAPRGVPRDFQYVVAIACSTGGPQALVRLLRTLPAGFPAPIVIAQHISHGFINGMAQWLGSLCAMPVSVGQEGELLRPGHIYLSPSEQNLCVTPRHRFQLQPSPATVLYHPSCDVLLQSVAEVYGRDAIGIILTGMGRDGVNGIRAIFQAGGSTFAQDEASSVIYGMNQEAVKAGVVQHELPLDSLPDRLLRDVRGYLNSRPEPRA
ncbi:chemotaxis-specific protein-glutamate methyltransferase CheB [Halomonas alkaliantarctica]|uniref:Protein-glutamate methylesterase/protein-glutamine glutaminase n=1 Tax=Halomonas alkaliantarctica TaxID=232346 RepID=A0ABY8LKM5_9GAMM|nr:chemotaxis-specific protein-glutamate methyltransferase CheB [Halomonas alkaliantarctica]WGI25000.1 chemotaxis-specific protein-glutamate methyltransferase CheB [Halomonas alkaliantarctica]